MEDLVGRYEKRIQWRYEDAKLIPTHIRWIVWNKDFDRAVEFHGQVWDPIDVRSKNLDYLDWVDIKIDDKKWAFTSLGIETHSSKQLYDFDSEPLKRCNILGGDCYTDGTSLGGTDFMNIWDGSDDHVFMNLTVKWL